MQENLVSGTTSKLHILPQNKWLYGAVMIRATAWALKYKVAVEYTEYLCSYYVVDHRGVTTKQLCAAIRCTYFRLKYPCSYSVIELHTVGDKNVAVKIQRQYKTYGGISCTHSIRYVHSVLLLNRALLHLNQLTRH